ncbi:MAG TPA: hypothetical protein VHW23_04810 [Kofleriaceae bacterium]|nr:hypothetical protein [Kofleriaceae bacterium]
MHARLAAELDLGDSLAFHVEHTDDGILVATRDAVHAVDGESLVPRIEAIEVVDMHGKLVLTPDRLLEVGGRSIALPPVAAGRSRAFAPVPGGGAIVAVSDFQDLAAAAVIRLDHDGHVVWHTEPRAPARLSGRGSEARPLVPTQWVIHRDELCVSGDRVLAIFVDMPRTGIGIGHGIDLETGRIVYRTAPAPHGQLAPARPGSFLVGLQGYGAFETQLVDRDGQVAMTWRSHGRVVPGDPVRVIEMENVLPSRCHASTLLADGTVHHGPALPGYDTSPLVIAADRRAVFWRDDTLMYVSADGERLYRLLETPKLGRPFVLGLAGRAPGRMVLSWTTNVEQDGRVVRRNKLLWIDLDP